MTKRLKIAMVGVVGLIFGGFLAVAPLELSTQLRRGTASQLYRIGLDSSAKSVWKFAAWTGDDVARANLAILEYRDFEVQHPDRPWDLWHKQYSRTDRALSFARADRGVHFYNRAILRLTFGDSSDWTASAVKMLHSAQREGDVAAGIAADAYAQSEDFDVLRAALADRSNPFVARANAHVRSSVDAFCEGIVYQRQAAEAGYQWAMVEFGELLVNGMYARCPDRSSGQERASVGGTTAGRDLTEYPMDKGRAEEDYQEGKILLRKAADLGSKHAILLLLRCGGIHLDNRNCQLRSPSEIPSLYERAIDEDLESHTASPQYRLNEDGALELNIWQLSNGEFSRDQEPITNAANYLVGSMHAQGIELPLDLEKAKHYLDKVPEDLSRGHGNLMPDFKKIEAASMALAADYFPGGRQSSGGSDAAIKLLLAEGLVGPVTALDTFQNKELYNDKFLSEFKSKKFGGLLKFELPEVEFEFRSIASGVMDSMNEEGQQTRRISKEGALLEIARAVGGGNWTFLKTLTLNEGSIVGHKSQILVTFDPGNIRVTSMEKGKSVLIPKEQIAEAQSWFLENMQRADLAQ